MAVHDVAMALLPRLSGLREAISDYTCAHVPEIGCACRGCGARNVPGYMTTLPERLVRGVLLAAHRRRVPAGQSDHAVAPTGTGAAVLAAPASRWRTKKSRAAVLDCSNPCPS